MCHCSNEQLPPAQHDGEPAVPQSGLQRTGATTLTEKDVCVQGKTVTPELFPAANGK